MTASRLLIRGGVQAGALLGHTLGEFRSKYIEPFQGSDPDAHLFKGHGFEANVIFYQERAIIIQLRKDTDEAFSDAEIKMELQRHAEGSSWCSEGGIWTVEHEHETIPPAIASVNADKTCLTIVNPAAMMERNMAKIASGLTDTGKPINYPIHVPKRVLRPPSCASEVRKQ